MAESIFAQDWRDCMIAHYSFVVQSGDARNEKSLRINMLKSGFTKEEIDQLYVKASATNFDMVNLHILEEENDS